MALILPLLVLVLAMLALIFYQASRPPRWTLVAEGALEDIEYKEYRYQRRSGAMVHSTRYETVRYNTLHFKGGTVLYGITGVLETPETVVVRLMRSNHGEYCLEPYVKEDA